MTESTQRVRTREESFLGELPFRVLIWVASAVSEIAPEEIEVFQKMLNRRRWCKSEYAKQLLPVTAELYSECWNAYQDGDIKRELYSIQQAMELLPTRLETAELRAFAADMEYLGQSIARASTGLLGLTTFRKESQRALNQLSLALDCQLVVTQSGALQSAVAGGAPGEPAPSTETAGAAPPAKLHVDAARHPVASASLRRIPFWPGGKFEAECIQVIDVTHDVKTFRFVSSPSALFSFAPGQFVTLELEIDNKRVFRSYTISSTPSRPHSIDITVKRIPDGLVSNWLHQNVHKGDQIILRGPAGDFSCFNHSTNKLLMISAGSGVTPVMSMSRWLTDVGVECDIVFLHAARTESDIIFGRELETMAESHSQFHSAVTLTRQQGGRAWNGYVGHIDSQMIRETTPDFMERTVFCCGPEGFMATTKELIGSLGIPMGNYHEESFGRSQGSARKTARVSSGSVSRSIIDLMPVSEVHREQPVVGDVPAAKVSEPIPSRPAAGANSVFFARSEKEIDCDEETTILELADSVGVDIPSACRAGVCGTCKVEKTEGEVRMDSGGGLEPHEESGGYILTCVSIANGRVVVNA